MPCCVPSKTGKWKSYILICNTASSIWDHSTYFTHHPWPTCSFQHQLNFSGKHSATPQLLCNECLIIYVFTTVYYIQLSEVRQHVLTRQQEDLNSNPLNCESNIITSVTTWCHHSVTTRCYHKVSPHGATTWCYHMLSPHCATTRCCHNVTTQCYHTVLPHSATTQCYHTVLPHSATTRCYHTVLPHGVTTRCYHTVLPHGVTTQCYHTVLPHGVTTLCYHTVLPHGAQLEL